MCLVFVCCLCVHMQHLLQLQFLLHFFSTFPLLRYGKVYRFHCRGISGSCDTKSALLNDNRGDTLFEQPEMHLSWDGSWYFVEFWTKPKQKIIIVTIYISSSSFGLEVGTANSQGKKHKNNGVKVYHLPHISIQECLCMSHRSFVMLVVCELLFIFLC